MSRDMLIACLESCLYFFGFEFVAFGYSSLSGCSFFGPWFESSWLVVGVGVDGEFAEYFSGFGVDDCDVEVVDEHFDSGSCVFCAQSYVVPAACSA